MLDVGGEEAGAARPDRALVAALVAVVMGGVTLAWCQRDYVNADFVAYSAIAQRLLDDPGRSVSAYWSPLYSWAMAPLLWLGFADAVAGRLVLLLTAVGYVSVLDFAVRHATRGLGERAAFVRSGMLACGSVQAILWASYLLGPDLLGSLFTLLVLGMVLAAGSELRPLRALAIGAAIGGGYLAKSFQLPFLVVAVPLAVWVLPRRRDPRPLWSASLAELRRWSLSLAPVAVGMLAIAGPWIAVLSHKLGHWTMSSAGSANHANVGPGVLGLDRLWRPPLEAGFVVEPHCGPDWSPIGSAALLGHQLRLLGGNAVHAVGLLGGPVLLLLSAWGVRAWRRRRVPLQRMPPGERRLLLGAVALAVIYVGGAAAIVVCRRYLLPTLAPLLLFAGLLASAALVPGLAVRRRALALGTVLALLFSAQELRLCWITAVRHPQSVPARDGAALAEELTRAGLGACRFAASRWHEGLMVAHAGRAIDGYLGTPWAADGAAKARALEQADVRVFVDFEGAVGGSEARALDAGWRRAFRSASQRADGALVDVYVQAR